ncbi:unnamed protein product [Psylliodes chrysocephalus]|uniref:MADF domain-containing protein n=1 Tax=Psylliodes chrysocephalus TaxID=3402493 RepID=A0A9P0DDF9_9CUCU|nr:unnamed protein product [Psylliodes chrysocephala]
MVKFVKTVKRITFSDEKIIELIELYRENECLWNIKSAEYKNNIKRKAAITDIAKNLFVKEEIIKKKITSIRSTYLMEKKKILDSHKTGSGTDDLYSPLVPLYEHMTFLNDVIIARKTKSNLESQIIEEKKKINENMIIYDINQMRRKKNILKHINKRSRREPRATKPTTIRRSGKRIFR